MGAAPIGPGDIVECIDARGSDTVAVGSIYTVEDAGLCRDIPCLILQGVAHPHGYRWVRAEAFRLIYRRDETLTARLLSDIPADAPASPEEVVA